MDTQSRPVPDYDDFLGLTFGAMLDRVAKEVPDKEVFVFRDQRITYGEFSARVHQMARALKRIGVRKGDRVGVLFANCPEFFYLQQAILYVGAVFIALSTRYRKFEISYMMKHAGARFLFSVDEYLGIDYMDLIEELRPELPELESVVVKGGHVPAWARCYEEVFEQGMEGDEKLLTVDMPDAKEMASILYTSGSTGTPKGVVHSHYSLMWPSTRVCERLRIGADDIFLLMLPCSHIFASFVVYTNAVMGRAKIVVMETFDPLEALRLQQAERVSILYGVPTMFSMMLAHPEFEKFDLTSNRTGYMSGASCPVELVQAVVHKMHNNISAAYGLSEANCSTLTDYEDDERVKSETAGRPVRGVEIKVVDDNRREVKPGEVGEIAIRADNLFMGYYKQPELTKASFDSDGYFYTGDLVRLDETGRVIVAGRKKEMIIRGGFNVYPAEVEEHIHLVEGVELAAVVGVSDPKLGERVCACVVPVRGHPVNPEEIRAFCRRNLANYKVPDFIEIMESFPMTTTQKIQRFLIRESMEKKYGRGA